MPLLLLLLLLLTAHLSVLYCQVSCVQVIKVNLATSRQLQAGNKPQQRGLACRQSDKQGMLLLVLTATSQDLPHHTVQHRFQHLRHDA
jgi:hypothetical protein